MSHRDVKAWTCKNGHILGFIRWNGAGLPQLMVLRESLDMEAERPEEVDLLGPLDGQMWVRCQACGDLRLWKVSVESLLALFLELEDEEVLEFSRRLMGGGGKNRMDRMDRIGGR